MDRYLRATSRRETDGHGKQQRETAVQYPRVKKRGQTPNVDQRDGPTFHSKGMPKDRGSLAEGCIASSTQGIPSRRGGPQIMTVVRKARRICIQYRIPGKSLGRIHEETRKSRHELLGRLPSFNNTLRDTTTRRIVERYSPQARDDNSYIWKKEHPTIACF
jgi:hypothetical protein